MDGSSAKKSTSLETLVIQNITNLNELKAKLNDIIKSGKNYEYEVSSCLKTLLTSSDQDIVVLTVQAVSELAKCEEKRETYAQKEVIDPIINILEKEIGSNRTELIKQCCRALGNLCCDCDRARNVIQECNGIPVLKKLLEHTLEKNDLVYDDIKILASKTLLNFGIGGSEFSDSIIEGGLIDLLQKILSIELDKNDMNDEMVSTALLIMSVINDNTPEFLYDENVNKSVLSVLRETTNIEISELCLDHLHAQAEHDSVKTLLANEGGMQLVCSRLEQLIARRDAGELNADDSEVEAVIKQACDLIVIVLTGDEAMHTLYNGGSGEVYQTSVRWLRAADQQLRAAAVLAVGNFARQDDYCRRMMEDKIFDTLLDILEEYLELGARVAGTGEEAEGTAGEGGAAAEGGGAEEAAIGRMQHAVLAAIRNLLVSVPNKRAAGAGGRAARVLLGALAGARAPHVAYKLLAALRMLVDGQESVARQLMSSREALACAARWGGGGGGGGGAAGEAPRLLAWAARQLPRAAPRMLQVEGCTSSLVNMLVVCHSVMQNEAILALTLLAIESLNKTPQADAPPDFDYEKSFITQLIKSEIGKHVSVLIETNCAKMPMEVAENLLAFLDITSKKNLIAEDYKEAKVHESLRKFRDARKDFGENLKACINSVVDAIENIGQE